MALPRHIRPEYSDTIPSTGKKIKYQPFTVAEAKILVLANESKDPDEVANAISNIIKICVTSPEDLKVEDLAIFDIEYLFLKVRSKSSGEKVTIRITDPSDPNGYSTEHEILIDKIQVQKDPKHNDLIKLQPDTVVKIKYPGMDYFLNGIDLSDVTKASKVLTDSITQITIGEEVFNRSDMSDKEIQEWVDSLTAKEFAECMTFFNTMPKLKHTIKLNNPNTNKPFSVELEGLADFL